MHMVEYISMKNGNRRTLRGVDRDMMDWMRYHTIQDLRDLAFEMYNRGEDISEMVQLIHEMDGMAHVTNMANENRVYDFAEYDILSYVEECEKSYVYTKAVKSAESAYQRTIRSLNRTYTRCTI